MKQYTVASLGATGAVGTQMLECLNEQEFPVGKLKLLASARSAGKTVEFRGEQIVSEAACPEGCEGWEVPKVLLGGDHAAVARWRRKKSLERTMDTRPDMFTKLELTDKTDLKLVEEIKKERSRMKLTKPVECRKAVPEDMDEIMLIVRQARNYLKKHSCSSRHISRKRKSLWQNSNGIFWKPVMKLFSPMVPKSNF